MKRFVPFLSCVFLAGIAMSMPALAIPSGEGGVLYCSNVCATRACNTICTVNGGETTCGEYNGAPATDLDRDGVPNTSDNCLCTANSNQANCDHDTLGDACDSTDNSWTRIALAGATCAIDIDNHFIYETMEIYGKDVYKSSCTGATCVKKVLIISFDCPVDVTQSCCDQHWIYPDCHGPWGYDICGTPRCAF